MGNVNDVDGQCKDALCCNSQDEKPTVLVQQSVLFRNEMSASIMSEKLVNPTSEFSHNKVQSASLRRPASAMRELLMTAVRNDDAPAVLQIIAEGADVTDVADAMRLASHRGSATVIRELVAVGLSVNCVCATTGFAPLHLAAMRGHTVLVELLLDALADVNRLVDGSSALSLARNMGHEEVEEVIDRHLQTLLNEKKEGYIDEASQHRRAHVLPRVSDALSDLILLSLPTPPGALNNKPENDEQGVTNIVLPL